jgi:hypothetical protein
MAKKKSHGGKRSNSGRKPLTDKMVRIPLWVKESVANAHGGIEATKELCIVFLGGKKI